MIKDLKLPPAKHEAALAIASAPQLARHLNAPVGAAVLGEMRALLDDEEYENFVAAAARLSRRFIN